jgi:hypothetical protein
VAFGNHSSPSPSPVNLAEGEGAAGAQTDNWFSKGLIQYTPKVNILYYFLIITAPTSRLLLHYCGFIANPSMPVQLYSFIPAHILNSKQRKEMLSWNL